jgi:hypothetical protein
MDPQPSHLEGNQAFERYRVVLKGVRDCYLNELRLMRQLGYNVRALDDSLKEAILARDPRQISFSRLEVKLSNYLIEESLTDLYKAYTRSLTRESALLQEQKRLEAALGKIQLSEIEDVMVSAAAVPWCGAIGWRSRDRVRIFKEIWGRERENVANSILAAAGWWVFGPRLILVFEEARCRSCVVGEEKACSYFFGPYSVILEELCTRKKLHRQGMHGLFFLIHVSNLFAKECQSRARIYERAFQWPEQVPCPVSPDVATHKPL